MATKKILLVDQPDLFESLEQTFFHRDGFELIRARNGADVWERVFHENPDLVLIGLEMDALNGEQCCRRIKENALTASIPVILVVPRNGGETLERCRRAGCDDVLQQPISRHLFLEKAKKHLGVTDRAAPRVPTRLEVFYGPQDEELNYSFSHNLSYGGLFLECSSPLPPGTQLYLRLMLPDREAPVICNGRVAWVNAGQKPPQPRLPVGMGIELVDPPMEDLLLIRAFVKKQLART